MRPFTAALVVLLIVAGAAVAIAAWMSGSGDPAASPDTGAIPTATPRSEPTTEPTATPARTPEPDYDYPNVDSVGACYDPITYYLDGSLLAMRLWDCDEPHLAELLGVEQIDMAPNAEWPGQPEVDTMAEEICLDVFREYVGIVYEKSVFDMIYSTPWEESWANGDREVWCIAEASSVAPFTESLRDIRE